MKSEILSNLIQGTFALVIGIAHLIIGVTQGLAHCYWLAVGCFVFVAFFYSEKSGNESVMTYLKRIIKK